MQAINKAINAVYRNKGFWALLLDRIGAGAFDGGCYVVAKALADAFNGRVVTLLSTNNVPDHYGCVVYGQTFDFDGYAGTPEQWIRRFKKNEGLTKELVYAPYDVPSPDIPRDDELSDIVKEMLLDNYVDDSVQ